MSQILGQVFRPTRQGSYIITALTGWPKGLTALQANVILQNTFAIQNGPVYHKNDHQ